ncbi:sensor histidine kinase [Vibrio sp. Hep-1b-8]|uniref:sensor histidine kinase n=1 Tax=Vibrio sp. Hep-1b-8 TaxID=2144187 RepID=UPI001110D498|nr:sensor histidine kinase [Vibrio sp. Hep-1b-8]TMX45847.1 two-component sensor histidine kinase [Vibrio sp. Hep-1b-8]
MYRFSLRNSFAQRKDSLVFQLFSHMAAVMVSILLLQVIAEQALVKAVLKVPVPIKQHILQLAHQANVLIEEGDMDELADWANAQPYYLFVLDRDNQPLSHRQMHPHFEFKLRFLRELDSPLSDTVSKPLIGLGLDGGNTLVVQLPSEMHPAHRFLVYLAVSKVVIVITMLSLFSLILANQLKRPLDRLRESSRRLASGDFNISVVSELRSNTREFNDLARDFDDMTKEIHALAQRQRNLIRDVSHELRTPLARQNLALHLLRAKSSDSHRPLIERLEREVDQMDVLVAEILEYSRLENSRYEASYKPVCLESLISSQVEQSRLQLRQHQTMTVDYGANLPMIVTDQRLVLRCLNNLLTNSIKYAGDSAEIRVSVDTKSTHLGYVVVEVCDNGPGIPQSHIKEIFRPFTRLESSRNKQQGGYGLGLAIVKEAVSLLNGKVIASNRATGGLSVQLILPIRR